VVLLAYRVHDYAMEAVRAAESSGLVSAPMAAALAGWIRTAARVTVGHWIRLLAGAVLAAGVCLLALPVGSARQMALPYFKRRLGYLFHSLWRGTARGGALDASVSDSPS
jgi:hypothetical protein